MKISLPWLNDFVDLNNLSSEQICKTLTSCGLETSGIKIFNPVNNCDELVIGEIVDCWPHPNADKLKCTLVDVGAEEKLNIVCGAPNARKGIRVVIAPVNATLITFSGEKFKIKKSKIRGEVSEGMLCAEDEIGLSDNHEKIIELDTDLPNGSSLKEKDENLLFVELNKSILELSESKTGAIIVIERDVNLQNYIEDGVTVHCPVKCEVLNSIFYEGTPLHDGALIIRGAMIEAAHVFVTPTTRALQGHYGARHRAAIGISEVTDALIIVVSEETGRISFVEHGDLETISRDRFTQALSDKIATL